MYDFKESMMKFFSRFTHLIIAAVLVVSCQQEDVFDIPYSLGAEENQMLTTLLSDVENGTISMISITQLKDLRVSGEAVEITSGLVMKGYVTSSDYTGNFYKEIYVQDDPTSPTDAIRLLINLTDSYNMFNLGREIYINLKGLYIGEYRTGDGVVSIGSLDVGEDRLTQISEALTKKHVLRSNDTSELAPLSVQFSQISDDHVGMMVEVSQVSVVAAEVGLPYVDPDDSFDTQRTLEACEGFGKSSFILETSAYANFKQNLLPSGTGTIRGIVSKTYDGDSLVLMLNSIDDVDMTGEECSLYASVFEDDFSSGDFTNWTTYNVTGSQQWEVVSFGNPAPSAKMSGYSGGARVNEDWLISKAIDLSASSGNVFFIFDSVKRYSGDDIKVFYATDYAGGNPNSDGTWSQLSPTLDTNTGSWSSWTSSGAQTLDNATGGNLFIAFKYTSTSSTAATFEIDNVKIVVE